MRGCCWSKAIVASLVVAGGAVYGQDAPAQPAPRGPAPRPMHAPQPRPGQMQPGQPGGDGKMVVPRQFVEQLRQQNPEKFQQLMQLRKAEPEAFSKELRGLIRAWQKRNQKRRAGASEEELLCRELSWRYHDTDDEEEKEKLRRDLEVAVDQAFEVRMKAVESRIAHMEKELEKFRERLKQLKENRQPVCDTRVEELLRPPELNWNEPW